MSSEQKYILTYFSSFLNISIDFINENQNQIFNLTLKTSDPSAGKCLLGMLGDGITYGIAGAGVGAAPGCVTGAAIGSVIGFLSGAADHCFE